MKEVLRMHKESVDIQAQLMELLPMVNEANRAVDVVYNNQKELADTTGALDDRFAVMFRMVMGSLNAVRKKSGLKEIGPDMLQREFDQWSVFKTHPKWRDYTTAWYMGLDVSEIIEEAVVLLDSRVAAAEEKKTTT